MNNIRRNRIFRALTNGFFYLITGMFGAFEVELFSDIFDRTYDINLLKMCGAFIFGGLIVSLVRDKWKGRSLRWRHAEICLHIMTYLAIASVFTNNILFLILLWVVGLYVIVLQLVREDLIPIQGVQSGSKHIQALLWFSLIAVLTFGSLAFITSNGWLWWPVTIIVTIYVSVGGYFIIRAYRKKQRAKKACQEAKEEAAAQNILNCSID